MPRMRFSGRTYLSFQQTENAMRSERINEALDAGRRVFGDPVAEPATPEHEWPEVEEATQPRAHGLDVRLKDGRTVTIYAYRIEDAK